MIVMECERDAKLTDWLRATSFEQAIAPGTFLQLGMSARSSQPDLPPEVLRIPLGILFPLFRQIVEREDG